MTSVGATDDDDDDDSGAHETEAAAAGLRGARAGATLVTGDDLPFVLRARPTAAVHAESVFAEIFAERARAAVDAVRAGGLRGFLPLLALALSALAPALASALAPALALWLPSAAVAADGL